MKYAVALFAVALVACGSRASGVERANDRLAPLDGLAAAAEHACVRALAGDNDAVGAASRRVIEDWTPVRAELHRQGTESDVRAEVDVAVLELSRAARSSADRVVLARAANRVTGSMAELVGPGVI